MRGKSLALLLSILLVLGIGGFLLVRYKVFQNNINLGLDLQGGVHVVLEAVDTPEAPVKPDSIDRVKAVIENRVNQTGVKEPVIQKEGTRRLIVELAGVKDILTKSLGSNNAHNMVNATMDALKSLKRAEEVAKLRGKTVEELLG